MGKGVEFHLRGRFLHLIKQSRLLCFWLVPQAAGAFPRVTHAGSRRGTRCQQTLINRVERTPRGSRCRREVTFLTHFKPMFAPKHAFSHPAVSVLPMGGWAGLYPFSLVHSPLPWRRACRGFSSPLLGRQRRPWAHVPV